MGSAISTILALNSGLGQTLTFLVPSSAHTASIDSFAALILFLLCATFAKCSTLYLMMRLFNLSGRKSQTNHHGSPRLYLNVCLAILGIMALGGIASIATVSANCQPTTYIQPPADAKCSSQPLRWRIITGLDIATEAILILMTIVIVTPVHLAFHLKCQVVLAFLLRLPLVALAALRLYYVDQYAKSGNAGLAQTPIQVLQQVYMAWTIISATIPNLKAFVRSFGSGFGIGIDMETYTAAYGSKNSARQRSYEMRSVNNQGSQRGAMNSRHATVTGSGAGGSMNRSRIEDESDIVAPIRKVRTGEAVMHNHTTPRSRQGDKVGDFGDEVSIESVGSDKRIIRKDIQWHVGYEPRAI